MSISKNFEINERLFAEFLQYCKLNGIEDTDKEFIKIFTTGFNITKYGTSPFKKKEEAVMPVIETVTSDAKESVNVQEPKIEEEKPKKRKPRVKVIKTDN